MRQHRDTKRPRGFGGRLDKLNTEAFEYSAQARLDALMFTPKGHRKEHRPPLSRVRSELNLFKRGRYPMAARALRITALVFSMLLFAGSAYMYASQWIRAGLNSYLEYDQEYFSVEEDSKDFDTIVDPPITILDKLGRNCKPVILFGESEGVTCGGCRKDLFFGSYVECDGTHSDATFSGCSLMGGPECAFAPQRAVTKLQCAASCRAESGCNFFTYHKLRKTCELHLMARCHKEQFSAAGVVYHIPPHCRKRGAAKKETILLKPSALIVDKTNTKSATQYCPAVQLSTPTQGLTCQGCHKDVSFGRFVFCTSKSEQTENNEKKKKKKNMKSNMIKSINHEEGTPSHKTDCENWDGYGNCEFEPEVVTSRTQCEELCRSELESCNFFLYGDGKDSKKGTCKLFLTQSCSIDFQQRVPLALNAYLYELGSKMSADQSCPSEPMHMDDPTHVDSVLATNIAIAARDKRIRLLAARRDVFSSDAARATRTTKTTDTSQSSNLILDMSKEDQNKLRKMTAAASGLGLAVDGLPDGAIAQEPEKTETKPAVLIPSGYGQRLRGSQGNEDGMSPNPESWGRIKYSWHERRARVQMHF